MNFKAGKINFRISESEFKLFQEFILKETGLFFSNGRKHQLELGLAPRISELGLESFRDYYNYLKFQLLGQSKMRRLELQLMIDELTVQETYFFRNEPQFKALKERVIPEIAERRSRGKRMIRVWSAGCSTGQEPYSIAMLLLLTLPEPETWNVSILATDINHHALQTASEGIYQQKAIESVPHQYFAKFFKVSENGFVIKDNVKNPVQFVNHNLVTDPYNPLSMTGLDIIFCRNVAIYFNLETTKQVIERFYRGLNGPGYLFLGHSETLWKISEQFKPVEYPGTFYYLKEGAERYRVSAIPGAGAVPASGRQAVPPRRQGRPGGDEKPEDRYGEALEALEAKNYERALSLFGSFDSGHHRYAQSKLAEATILSDQGRDDDAVTILERIVLENTLSEEAYFLLGLLYKRNGTMEKAITMFQKALYVNPENPLTHYYLAGIYKSRGEIARARKNYKAALGILKILPEDYVFPFFDALTPDLVTENCTKELESLRSS
jgi:chemotaxis protein methyltransferase CheR